MELSLDAPREVGPGALPRPPAGAGQRGVIEVSPRAVARVARRAAMESYGVVGLSARLGQGVAQWVDHWLRRLLRRPRPRRLVLPGVEVGMTEQSVVVDLYVVVEYGTRISEVAVNVAEGVRFAVERALGLPVVQVNVTVAGVRVSRGA